MQIDWKNPKIFSALVFSAIIFIGFLSGKIISGTPIGYVILAIVGIAFVLIILINTDVALVILILSMLFSPELSAGGVSGRDIVIRFDDILLGLISFTWLAKLAYKKGLSLFIKTPLNKAIGFYLLVCIVSTLRGTLLGYVEPAKGFFYVLRYGEYFLLFFLVANHIHSKKQVKFFLTFMFLTCALVSALGILQIPSGRRVSAPFEGEVGEPNTLGGYLLILLFVAAGILLQNVPKRLRLTLFGLCILIFIPFLFTLSRSSYLAMVISMFALIILSKKKLELTAAVVTILLLIVIIHPKAIFLRVEYTFQGEGRKAAQIGGIRFDPSTSERINSWDDSFRAWGKRPILGRGITGFGFIDGQYIRTFPELGLFGIWALLWLLWTILKNAYKIFKNMDDELFKGLTMGYLAAFIGLLIHALSSNTFIILRIMEPFWFLTGIVIMLPSIAKIETEKTFLEEYQDFYKELDTNT